MKKLTSLVIVLMIALTSFSTNYIVESPFRSGARAYTDAHKMDTHSLLMSAFRSTKNDTLIIIPNGTEIVVNDTIKRDKFVKITYEGKECYINSYNLKLSENNPEGTINPLEDNMFGFSFSTKYKQEDGTEVKDQINFFTMKRDSTSFKFYTGLTLPILICIIALVLGILIAIGDNKGYGFNKIGSMMIYVAPILFVLLSILELVYFIHLGKQTTWWCNFDNLVGWRAVLGWLPFCIAFIAQTTALSRYHDMVGDWYSAITSKWAIFGNVICSFAALIIAFCIGIFGMGMEEKATSVEATMSSLKLIMWMAIGISLIFPILYYPIKYRSFMGLIFGIVLWFSSVVYTVIFFLFIGATWSIIRIAVLPLIGIIIVLVMFNTLTRFKSVKTGSTTYYDENGNMRKVEHTTMEYEKDGGAFDGLLNNKK